MTFVIVKMSSPRWLNEEIVKSYHQNIISNYKSYVDKCVNTFYLNGIEYEKEDIDTSNSLIKEQKKHCAIKNHCFTLYMINKKNGG